MAVPRIRPGVVHTAIRCRCRPTASVSRGAARVSRTRASLAAVNAYHVCGGLFAVWAVIVSFLGITREDFPGGAGGARLVALVSILLAVATIGSAIYTGATEDEEEGGEHEAALVLGS